MNNIYILVIGLIFISVLMLIYKQILKKIRIIEDLPTSSIKGVFIGLVEIKGMAETEKSSKNFSALIHELSNTEDRVALVRNYFNEAASWQNTRLERIPEGWIARLAGINQAKIWNAEGFKCSNVDLNLKS